MDTPFYFRDVFDQTAILLYRKYVDHNPLDLPVHLIFRHHQPNPLVVTQMLAIPAEELTTRLQLSRDTLFSICQPPLLKHTILLMTEFAESMRGFVTRQSTRFGSVGSDSHQPSHHQRSLLRGLGFSSSNSAKNSDHNQLTISEYDNESFQMESSTATGLIAEFWVETLKECIQRGKEDPFLVANGDSTPAPAFVLHFWMDFFLNEAQMVMDDKFVNDVGFILSAITEHHVDGDGVVCDYLRGRWHKLASSEVEKSFDKIPPLIQCMSFMNLHISHNPKEIISIIESISLRLLKVNKSSNRAVACNCLHRLFYSLAFKVHPDTMQSDITQEWRSLLRGNQNTARNLLKLLRTVQRSTESWLKRDRHNLELEIWRLKLTLLRLILPETFVSEAEVTVEALLKLVRPDHPDERQEIVRIISSFYCTLRPKLICDNAEDFKSQVIFIVLAILQLIRKRQSLQDHEMAALVELANHVGRCSPKRILIPVIEELVGDTRYSVEVQAFGLRMLASNCERYPEDMRSLTCSEIVFSVVEELEDRDLVLMALPILPYLEASDRAKRLVHLKLTIGLTRSKFDDISDIAFKTLKKFVEIDPQTCLLPVVNTFIDRMNAKLNSDQQQFRTEDDGPLTHLDIEDDLRRYLSLLVDVLSRHQNLYGDNGENLAQEIASVKWIEVRQEAESLAIHCLLRRSFASGSDNLQDVALKMLQLLSSNPFRSYNKTLTIHDVVPDFLWDDLKAASIKEVTPKAEKGKDDKHVENWWKSIEKVQKTNWPAALGRIIDEHWDIYSTILIRVWRQLFLRWNWYENDMLQHWQNDLTVEDLESPKTVYQIRFLTWINHLTFLYRCLNGTTNGVSIKEMSNFVEDCCRLMFQTCWFKQSEPIDGLSPMSHALLWALQSTAHYAVTSGLMVNALQLCWDDVLNEVSARMEENRKRSQEREMPSFYRIPISIYLLAESLENSKAREQLSRKSYVRDTFLDFFHFWLQRENIQVLPVHDEVDWKTRLRIGQIMEKFLHYAAGQQSEDPDAKTAFPLKNHLNDLLLFVEALISDISSHPFDVQEKLERCRIQVIKRIIECGALPNKPMTELSESNATYREAFQMILIQEYVRKDFLREIIEEAYASLLTWNTEFSKTVFRMAYSCNLRGLNVIDENDAIQKVKYLNLLAIVRNVEKDPMTWISNYGLARLLYTCFLNQCSHNIRNRIIGMQLASAILKGSKGNSAAQEVALTMPNAASAERFLYFDKAYQLSGVLSLVYPEEATNFLHRVAKAFSYLTPKDRTHLLMCLPPWMKAIGKKMCESKPKEPVQDGEAEEMSEQEQILHSLFVATELAFASDCPRKSIEFVWHSFFKGCTENEFNVYDLTLEFLGEKWIAAKLEGDEEYEHMIRECVTFTLGSRNGKLGMEILMSKLRSFAKSDVIAKQQLPTDIDGEESNRFNSFDDGHYTDEELAAFTFLTDLVFKKSEMIVGIHLPLILQNAICLFQSVPFCNKVSYGNQMIWYLIEYLALKRASCIKDLTMMARWQRESIPQPTSERFAPVKDLSCATTIAVLVQSLSASMETLEEHWTRVCYDWCVRGDLCLVPNSLKVLQALAGATRWKEMVLPALTNCLARGLKSENVEICDTVMSQIHEAASKRLIPSEILRDLASSLIAFGINSDTFQEFDAFTEGCKLMRTGVDHGLITDFMANLTTRMNASGNNWEDMDNMKRKHRLFPTSLNDTQFRFRIWFIRQLSIEKSQCQQICVFQNSFMAMALLLTADCIATRITDDSPKTMLQVIESTLEWVGQCSSHLDFQKSVEPVVRVFLKYQQLYTEQEKRFQTNGPLVKDTTPAPERSTMASEILSACIQIFDGPYRFYETLGFVGGLIMQRERLRDSDLQLMAAYLQYSQNIGDGLLPEQYDLLCAVMKRWHIEHLPTFERPQESDDQTDDDESTVTRSTRLSRLSKSRGSVQEQHPVVNGGSRDRRPTLITKSPAQNSKWVDWILLFLNRFGPREALEGDSNVRPYLMKEGNADRVLSEKPNEKQKMKEERGAICAVIEGYFPAV